jgi:hypothetical protein
MNLFDPEAGDVHDADVVGGRLVLSDPPRSQEIAREAAVGLVALHAPAEELVALRPAG